MATLVMMLAFVMIAAVLIYPVLKSTLVIKIWLCLDLLCLM